MTPAEIQAINHRQMAEWRNDLDRTHHVPAVLISVQADGEGAACRVHARRGADLDRVADWIDAAWMLVGDCRAFEEERKPAGPPSDESVVEGWRDERYNVVYLCRGCTRRLRLAWLWPVAPGGGSLALCCGAHPEQSCQLCAGLRPVLVRVEPHAQSAEERE